MQLVKISVVPDKKPEIIQVTPIKEEVKTVTVTESKKSKTVSQVTGATITVTTDKSEVASQAQVFAPAVIKVIPDVAGTTPVSIKTTESGEISWNTIVYSDEKKSIQVTSLYNKTDKTVTVIDSKPINKTIVTGSQNVPETQVYVIPSIAITATSKKLVEIQTIVKEVETTYKKSQIESLEV